MQSTQNVSNCLFLILLGSIDCLTTVIGTAFFGTQEMNPLLAGLVNSNLSAFVAVKLTVTVAVGLIFLLAQRTLNRTVDHKSNAFKVAARTLNLAYFAVMLFLAIVVANNILVLLHLII